MLWEEMEKYTELTGEDATHVPIMKIGAYLDGYEKGSEVLGKVRAEIEELEEGITSYHNDRPWIFKDEVLAIINKYKAESEE